jgi:hypothetical protein
MIVRPEEDWREEVIATEEGKMTVDEMGSRTIKHEGGM